MNVPIGTKVKVINVGETYTSYIGFIQEYARGYEQRYIGLTSPIEGRNYIVVGKGEHPREPGNMLYIIEDSNSKIVYIVGASGLKAVDYKEYTYMPPEVFYKKIGLVSRDKSSPV